MEQLLAENARATEALMGVATLRVPTVDEDDGLRMRYHALWRALYPRTAPTAAAQESVTSPPQTSTHAIVLRHDTAMVAVTPSPDVTAAPTQSAAPVSALLSTKRAREPDAILDVDPDVLRARHELTVRQSCASAAASETTTTTPPPSWKMSKVLVGHQGWVWAVAVDPTNAWFASGAFDAVIKVWDLASGALKLNLTGHKESVRALALSRTSPYMFSGSDDRSIKCWDLERNEIIRDFFGHKSAVHCLAVHPALDVVVSGGRDKTVRVWDIRTRAVVHTLVGHTDSVMSLVAQQPDPQVISGGNDGLIYLWDLAAGRSITRLTRHKKPVRGLALHPHTRTLVSCGADEVRVWSMPTGEYVATASTTVGNGGVDAVSYRWSGCAMSPRNVLAVGSQDGQLAFYDWGRPQPASLELRHYAPYQFTKTRSMPGTLPGEGGVNALCFDVSGTRLITAESDKSVKIWRLRRPDEQKS